MPVVVAVHARAAPLADPMAAAIPGRAPLAAKAAMATAAQAVRTIDPTKVRTVVRPKSAATRGAAYGPHGAAAGSTRDVSATGPKGQTYNSQEERGAAAGPDGAAAGSTRDVSATGAKGQTYNSQQERGAAAGPNGAVAGGSRSTSTTALTAKPIPASAKAPQVIAPLTRRCQPTPVMARPQLEQARPPTRAITRQRRSAECLRRPRRRGQKLVQRVRHVWRRLACGQSGRVGSNGLEGRLCVDAGHLAHCRCIDGLGGRCSAGRVQLRQQRHLPGRSGLLWQPTGSHGRSVLSAGFDVGTKRVRRQTRKPMSGCLWECSHLSRKSSPTRTT